MDTIAPFRISVCGLAELGGHCETGISHVLSILDPDWPVPEELGAFGEHARLELRFHDVIEDDDPDMIASSERHVIDLLAFGRDLLAEPPADAHLLVHCRAGVSRSTASMALILAQALPDVSGKRIFDEIRRIRPQAWPNPAASRTGRHTARGVVLRIDGKRAFYSPSTDHVQMPPQTAFRSAAAWSSVLLHEIGNAASVLVIEN